MGERVTVYDVAKECGMSPSTVSRVLNNSVLVGDARRELILAAAKKLGYKKRTIRKQESRAILNIKLFLPETRYALVHMFYDVAELVEGIQEGFGEVKVNIITRINRGEDEVFGNKKLGDIDGCVFAFTEPDRKLVRILKERGISTVLLNRKYGGLHYVQYDEEACMTTLLEQIVEKRGNRRKEKVHPCFIGFTPVPYINHERKEGLSRACRRYGIDFSLEKDVFDFNAVREIPADFLEQLKQKGYNTIFCFNDLIALSVYQCARLNGHTFPGEFSLTGFDDSPTQELLPQRIDTIRFNVGYLGLKAGSWLKRRIIQREDIRLEDNLPGLYVEGETI